MSDESFSTRCRIAFVNNFMQISVEIWLAGNLNTQWNVVWRKLPQNVPKKEKDIDTTWINDLRNLRVNWVYRSYRDRKQNNLISSCRCKKNLHISRVISNQQWILLACIFSFKNTYNSNVSKGKKTGRRSWLLYRRFSCNHSIHSRSISGSLQRSGFQDVCLFVYFLSSVSFNYSRRPTFWYFRFKSVERVGNCVVRSLDVGKRVWQESLVSGAQCGLLVYNFGRPRANKINPRNLWQRGAHKAAALISKAIESSVSWTNALTDTTKALTDMHELLTNWLTPLTDTTNALTATAELLTNCLMPLTIFIESSSGWLTDS